MNTKPTESKEAVWWKIESAFQNGSAKGQSLDVKNYLLQWHVF